MQKGREVSKEEHLNCQNTPFVCSVINYNQDYGYIQYNIYGYICMWD